MNGSEQNEQDDSAQPAIGFGGVVGILTAIVTCYTSDNWPAYLLSALALVGGLAWGLMAKTQDWSGEMYTRRTTLSAYSASIALLVVGPLLDNPFYIAFPLFFVVTWCVLFGLGMLGKRSLDVVWRPS